MKIDKKYISGLTRESLEEDESLEMITARIVEDADKDDRDALLVEFADRLRFENLPEQAARVVNHISVDWASEKATLLGKTASDLHKIGNEQSAVQLLTAALRVSRGCDVAWQEAEVRVVVARVFLQMKMADVALDIFLEAVPIAKRGEREAGIQDSIDASSVLADIAEELAAIGSTEEARKVALGIENSLKRKRALKTVGLLP